MPPAVVEAERIHARILLFAHDIRWLMACCRSRVWHIRK